MNISAYFFKDACDGIVDEITRSARSAALQIAERPEAAADILKRVQSTVGQRYPDLGDGVRHGERQGGRHDWPVGT